jgi:hypothetical protein
MGRCFEGAAWLALALASLAGCGGGHARGDGGSDVVADTVLVLDAPPACAPGGLFSAHEIGGAWPSPVSYPAMAPDRDRGEVVLFGGGQLDPPGFSNQTWTWNGTSGTWANRTPATLPPSWPTARYEHMMVWDSVRRTVLMFGGYDTSALGYRDELWEWNGAAGTWTNLTPTPRPSAWPAARTGHMMAYDDARGRLVLYGGFGLTSWPGFAGDLWEWDSAGATWTDRTPPLPLPATWPEPRELAGFGYDPVRGKMLLQGGAAGAGSPVADTWEWDGSAGRWTDRTKTPLPDEWPPSGIWKGIVLDPGRGRMVMLGGDGLVKSGIGLGAVPPQAWEWNGETGEWVDRAPAPLPSAGPMAGESAAALAADPAGGILFLGGHPLGESTLNDLWTWGCAR